MTRYHSIRAFFRQMPNALLARYFAARGVLADFDFTGMKETKIEALFDAWTALPEKDKSRMEGELREVWDMSCAPGYQAILDEADFHLNDEAQNANGPQGRLPVGLKRLTALPLSATPRRSAWNLPKPLRRTAPLR